MQQASMGKQDMISEEAGTAQSPFGPLQRGLTALPAYSGTAMVYCPSPVLWYDSHPVVSLLRVKLRHDACPDITAHARYLY